jgi:excisionase family DNA binding protein
MPRSPRQIDPQRESPVNEEGYLTTTDALAYLRTTHRTLYRLLATGNIPAMRMGHQWRFRKTDLDHWIRQRSGFRSPDRPDQEIASPAARRRARRVLVVDDEPLVREMLMRALAATEYHVEAAPDGFAALARLRTSPFDLVITDLRMPGVDGIEVAREAKRLWQRIKVVIITAYPSQSSAIEAVNLGVDGYVMKPFRVADLLMAAGRALEPESAAAASAHAGPTENMTDPR